MKQHAKGTSWARMLLVPTLLFGSAFMNAAPMHTVQVKLNQTVTKQVHKAKLSEVFKKMSSLFGYEFFYDESVVQKYNMIEIDLESVNFEQALEQIRRQTGLQLNKVNNTIVVSLAKQMQTSTSNTQAPKRKISGIVTDQNNEPLIGVSIIIEGNSGGTITDIDGHYMLDEVDGNAILVFSYIGYVSQKIVAGNQHTLNVLMKEDNQTLEEIVVVGYGTMKKANMSGAVSSIKADDLPTAGSASVGDMLRGRASGANITSSTASPGSSVNISIRGGLSGQAPLIVIDGIPQAGSASVSHGKLYNGSNKDTGLINLNPNDIESIDILKDASAAAIYGSDASGGVVLITTKRGTSGKPQVTYSGSIAAQTTRDLPKLLNATDFMTIQNEVLSELGKPERFSQTDIAAAGAGTDWLNEVTRTGMANEHNVSVTAGNEFAKSLFSLSYYDHQGVVKENSMNRITGRLNTDMKFNDHFKLGIQSSFAKFKYNDVPMGDQKADGAAVIFGAIHMNPAVPVFDDAGNYAFNPYREIYPNPMSLLTITDETTKQNFNVSAYLEYNPIKELSFRLTAGTDIRQTQGDQYVPTTTYKGTIAPNGQASKQNAQSAIELVNIVGNYNKVFSEKHDLNVMLGWEYKKSRYSGMGVIATDFPFDGALMNNLAAANNYTNVDSYKGSSEMASFFGRLNYSYDSRYILTANFRVDGSSNFAENHQWGAFPGVSLGWRLTEEKFMENLRNTISSLKLRLGIGQTGNAGSLTGVESYYTVRSNAAAFNGNTVNGVYLSNLGNPNLKWETLTDYTIGIDFGLWNNRLQGTIDLYERHRSDIITSKSLMSYHEVNSINYNSNETRRTRGIDVSLSSVNVATRNFEWTTDLNISFYRNQIIDRDDDFIATNYDPYVKDINAIYGFKTNGLIQTGEKINYLPNSLPGAIRYLDVDGFAYDDKGNQIFDEKGKAIYSGKADGKLDKADYVKLFSNTPIPFSLNNSFRWKNWDANIYIYGSLQGYRKNALLYNVVETYNDFANYAYNSLEQIKHRWTATNKNATLPGVAEVNSGYFASYDSDYFYEKAWYVRLDNVSLGYTIPSKVFKNKINSLRMYVAGRNLAVLTPFDGYDPETGAGSLGAYPNARSFAFGIEFKF